MDPKEENFRLKRELEERNRKLKQLQETVDELLFNEEDDQKDVKIISLAKKNRNLLMKLNKERGKSAQLERELGKMKKKSKTGGGKFKHFVGSGGDNLSPPKFGDSSTFSTPTPSIPDPEPIIRKHQKRYERLSSKFHENRQENFRLKSEIKKLKKILQDECGDDYKKSGWKGRAQQILVLKDQVSRLKDQIPRTTSGRSGSSSRKIVKLGPTASAHEELKQISLKRKEELDRTRRKVEQYEEKLSRIRKKKNAVDSRVSILERQQTESKMKMDRLIQKTLNDNKLIGLLKQKIETLKRKRNPSSPKTRIRNNKNKSTEDRLLRERLKVLEQELLEKTEKLDLAERQIREYVEEVDGEEEEEKKNNRIPQGKKNKKKKNILRKSGDGMRRTLLGFELERKNSYLKEVKDRVLELEDRLVKVNKKLMTEKLAKEKFRKKWETFKKGGGNSPTINPLEDMDEMGNMEEIEYLKNEKEILEENLVNLRKKWKNEVEMYQDIIMKQRERIEILSKKIKK